MWKVEAQHCGADLNWQEQIDKNPQIIAKRAAIEQFTQQWIAKNAGSLAQRAVITIPIVVHVVWKNAVENISDAQIQSQIEVLNRDFRAMNIEITSIPQIFKPSIADVEIEFCLASSDPNGNTTSGITRTQTDVDKIGATAAICYADQGGADAWDPLHYLNIWVSAMDRGLFIGYGSFPGKDPPEEDGVRVDYRNFGTIGTSTEPPYNLGHTTTHEIGHYFNLQHLWGSGLDNPDCSDDDGVSDTPLQSVTFKDECPVFPQVFCGVASMFMNFMNYTDDACMAMFTKGQKMRMLAALNGPRVDLLASAGCQIPMDTETATIEAAKIFLLQNPVRDLLQMQSQEIFSKPLLIRLINMQGQLQFSDVWNGTEIYTKNIFSLPTGIYFLVLQKGRNIFTKKLIITH